jgi:hypothetical protein
MSEQHQSQPGEQEPLPASQDGEAPPPDDQPASNQSPEESTIGTGTSIALGCVAATVLLVIIGLIFLIVVMILG